MSLHRNLETTSLFSISKPFGSIYSIKWRADQVLKKRNRGPEQWQVAAPEIQTWISDFVKKCVDEQIEKFIEKRSEWLVNEGGWELAYLPRDPYSPYQSSGPPTLDEIRDLLENWPQDTDEHPDFPSATDISDLDALHDILCSGYPYDDIEGFSSANEAEIYCVLALMKIDEAVGFLHVLQKKTDSGILIHPGPFPWRIQDVVRAGNLVVEAMEIICYAERQLSNDQLSEIRAEQKAQFESQIRLDTRTDTARKGGYAKNLIVSQAREFVQLESAQHRGVYKNNKTEFASVYAARLRNEFQNNKGDPLKVAEKTIREVWLKDTPPASKRAG